MKRWKKRFHANSKQKRTGVAILISDKIGFKWKKDYKRQNRVLYINKTFNTPRGYNNYKHYTLYDGL